MKRSDTTNTLKPAPGRRVLIHPTREPLPAEGKNVGVLTPYWHRRLHDGDVVFVTRAKSSARTDQTTRE